MSGMTLYSWLLIPALFIAFGCGTVSYYRLFRDRTPRAWTILAFSLFTFVVLLFYVIGINPYPQPLLVTRGFAALAFVLLVTGIGFVLFTPNGMRKRLPMAEVRALLPESILELSPEQMRSLLPQRFRSHALHEIQVFVMLQIADMSPEAIRNLSPERLRAALRRNVPYSILDQK